MTRTLFVFLLLGILFSCNNQQENKAMDMADTQDTLGSLQAMVLAEFPDSLQPKTLYLDKMPAAKVTRAGPGETKMLPVLQNEKGEPILDAKGKPFILGDGGLSHFTNFTTDNGLVLDAIHCSVMDKSGNLWFSTWGGGVSKYDGKSVTTFTSAQGLATNAVKSIIEDRSGNLWFGTWGGGVSKYDGKSFTTFTSTQGLANNTVKCIIEDKSGNLWFCTEKDLSILDAERLKGKVAENKNNPDDYSEEDNTNISEKIFRSFGIADGLPDNVVTNVTQMPDGKLAVGTNSGIALFNLSEDGSKLTDIEIFNTGTGYPIRDVGSGQNCMYLDRNGIIWAATGYAKTPLIRFDYAALQKNTEPPKALIQSVKVKGETFCWYNLQSEGVRKNYQDSATALLQEFIAYGRNLSIVENDSLLKRFGNIQFDSISRFYPLPQNLVLPYEHNQISFEFAAIETDKPFLVKYQYILEGYDKDWSPVTDKSSANFGNINEGTYTFKLKAQGANGIWSEPIRYTFKVLSPWYRTWWAYTIYALFFLFGLRVFVKWRERNLRMEKEKLEHTVEIRTAELVAEKRKSDDLLLNILPGEVAEELKAKGSADAKHFDEVTVMFTDFKGFTQISEKLTPSELVAQIDTCFKAFDNIIDQYNIEKIKTIGDAYICAGGLPVANKTNATDVVNAAIEIQQFMQHHLEQREKGNKPLCEIRIGFHAGPVVAGIVGIMKFAYDIWGDTMSIAARMESSGEAGKVNIGGSTFELIKDKFKCKHRGKIQAKNKGEIDMYFVEGMI